MFQFSAAINIYCIALERFFFFFSVFYVKFDIYFPKWYDFSFIGKQNDSISMLVLVCNSSLNNLHLQYPNTRSHFHERRLKGEINVFSVDPPMFVVL